MKPHMKRGLTRVALALMLAGYCAVPAAKAEEGARGAVVSGRRYGEGAGLGSQWDDR